MVEEAGEDTDGMAESVSQLQAKLKALTHGKVDIMADADTYKNTTQILREMSAAWEDMTDVERSAALELMGGKRQANILASIIKNFDTVEEVIQTSTNSQGSALKENEKYLDSIQGRLDQFSNSLQTFWNNMLNSNVIKGFVEFGTNVIKFLDTIPGKLIAISAIIAGLIKFKGFNVFGAGKTVIAQLQTYQQAFYKLASFKSMNLDIGSTGSFNTQAVNAYAAAVQGLTAKTQAQMLAAAGLNAEQAREVLTVNNITEAEQNEALVKANLTNSTRTLQTARVADVITTDMAADKDQEAAISAFLAENANKKLSIALLERAVETGALSAEQAAQIASDYALTGANMTLASSFKAVGSAIALAFKTNPVGMILTIITTILTATSIIDGFTQSAEEAAQAAKDALSTYNSTQTELQNQKSTVDELIASYQRLSSGVDTTNNQNIGLTTTSYQEYLDTVNSIADMFPELIAGYDSEGNALLTLKGKIDSVTEAYENKQKAAAAQFLTKENKENIWKSYNDTINSQDFWHPHGSLAQKKELLEVLQSMTDEDLGTVEDLLGKSTEAVAQKKFTELLSSKGAVSRNWDQLDVKEVFKDYGISGIVEEVETADGEIIKSTNKFRDNLATALSNINSTINSEMSNIKQAVSAGLIWNSDYQKLDKDAKAFVDSIVNNLDPDIIAQSGATGIDDFVSKLMTSVNNADSELITGINDVQSDVTKAILSGDDQGFKEAQKKFEDLIPDDWYVDGEIKINDNDDMITKYLKGLAQDIEEQSKNYEVQLQFKEDYIPLKDKDSKDTLQASKLFGDGSDSKDAAEYIKVAREMSNVSDMLAKSYQAVANAWAGDDKILETDELIDAYNQWVNAGYTAPEGSNWTEDQIAALQILKALIGEYNTDINTIAQSFANVGVAVKTVNFDLSETLNNNSEAIDSIQENISSYQDALEKLESGSFTMSDFVDLIQKFPDLAKGVKVTSKGFDGLSGNLKKAIRSSPKELINSLKDTRSQLQALGKDTTEIDGLITALEQLPNGGVDELSEEFITLADGMDDAKKAYNELQEAMSKNPNQGYETRAEAIDKMKELMEEGKIGSESELWDIAKAFFGDDPDKFPAIANKDTDALYKLITAREEWYAKDEDGNLTYEGTENFIKDVESALGNTKIPEIQKLLSQGFKWDYNNGELNFDFGDNDFDTVVNALSKTSQLAGLTSGEFADLIVQVGQYFKIWEDAGDVSSYIKAISESSEDNTTKMEKMTDAVESYYKKATGKDIDLTSLDEAGVKALDLNEDLETLLLNYLELADKCKDPLEITKNLEDANKRMKELGATDYTFNFESKDFDDLTTQIDNAKTMLKNLKNEDGTLKVGVSKEDYQAAQNMLAALIRQKQSLDTAAVLKVNTADADSEIGTVIQKLQQFKSDYNELEIQTAIGADTTEAQQNLNSAIASLQEENPKVLADLGIDLTKSNSEINAAINSITPEVMVKCGLDASLIEGYQEEEHEAKGKVTWNNDTTAVDSWARQSHTADGTVKWGNDTTNVKTSFTATGTINWSGTQKVNGTAHANGTAFSSGSWGAPKTETALTGELGPELLVRGNKWITVGENGAEFTQVKRGDIIFNHEQTKQLFENGYVTSRGKAYAEGTAYLSGGGRHKTYTFSTSSSASNKKSSSSSSNSRSSSTSNNMSDAADSANEFEETFDWLEIKLEEVNEQLDLMNAKLENAVGYSAKNTIIDQMLSTNKSKLSTLEKGVKLYKDYSNQLLKEIPSQYREMAKNGSIAITEFAGDAEEKTVEAINNYRDWAQKVADLTQQMEELKTEIADLAKQKFDNVSDQYDNAITLIENQTEKLDDQVSLMEDRGYVAAKEYYEAMISSTKQQSSELVKEKKALQGVLDQQVKLGNIKKYDERWYEMVDAIYEVDSAIVECTSDLEEYQNAINDIYWDNFDGLTSRLDYLSDETQSLIDLMEDSGKLISTPEDKEFWSEKDVKWTEEGIVSLGLYAQQMEIAEYHSKQYKKAINDLNKDYKDGKYSETEYLDKLNELKSAQYDTIGAYYDAQEAVKDLNETRVDSIKKGIEKEIDAYEKLIDKKKEELDSEKDLYDFQKSTMEQQKDISDIQRKLAALSGDNSASAIAKRKQLEADLAEAKSALEESYYDRSIDQRQEALDKELEDFQDEKNAEIEKWEKYLDQIELVVADSLSIVQDNASLVYDTLNEKADEYNLTLSDAILTPWKDGALAVSDYQTVFDTAMSSTTDQLEAMKNKWQEVIDKMSEAAGKEIQKQKEDNKKTTSATYKKPKPATSAPKKNTTSKAKAKKITTGSKINAKGAKIYGYAGGQGYTQYFSSDPIYVVLGEQNGYYKVRYHKASSGVTGWFKKSDVKAYAKGSKGIDKDQWALLDELGPELQLVPDSNGRLAYIQRGTSIIPSDISENLMKLGQLDPQDVLDRNRPQIGVPHITNNEISINMDIAEVVHIDKVTNDTLPDLAKVVEKQMDSYMVKINNSLKKFTR